LLQDRIAAVPERQREAEVLHAIAEAGDPVLAPAVGAAARVIVGEVVPRRPAGAVVLAHGPPLALAQVGSPVLPRGVGGRSFGEPRLLRSGKGLRRRRIHGALRRFDANGGSRVSEG